LVALYQKSLKETNQQMRKDMKPISILSLRIKKWVVLGKPQLKETTPPLRISHPQIICS
jgi:hypothetical protein